MNNNLKDKLTPLQFDITQNCSTEKPFDNEYWDNQEEGIYVDIIPEKHTTKNLVEEIIKYFNK